MEITYDELTAIKSGFFLQTRPDIVRSGDLRIPTIFCFPDGHHIDVFISLDGTVSDFGQTVDFLEDMGLPVRDERLKDKVIKILQQRGMSFDGEMISESTSSMDEVEEKILSVALTSILVWNLYIFLAGAHKVA